jgi:hypothetical protein
LDRSGLRFGFYRRRGRLTLLLTGRLIATIALSG